MDAAPLHQKSGIPRPSKPNNDLNSGITHQLKPQIEMRNFSTHTLGSGYQLSGGIISSTKNRSKYLESHSNSNSHALTFLELKLAGAQSLQRNHSSAVEFRDNQNRLDAY